MPFRSHRFLSALIALAGVLFMQLALAAYACPGMGKMATMEGCEGMEMMQPSLCHAQDHAADQSLDKPEPPAVQPFVPVALVASVEQPRIALPADVLQADTFLLARATSPPLSIRNCCFRI